MVAIRFSLSSFSFFLLEEIHQYISIIIIPTARREQRASSVEGAIVHARFVQIASAALEKLHEEQFIRVGEDKHTKRCGNYLRTNMYRSTRSSDTLS